MNVLAARIEENVPRIPSISLITFLCLQTGIYLFFFVRKTHSVLEGHHYDSASHHSIVALRVRFTVSSSQCYSDAQAVICEQIVNPQTIISSTQHSTFPPTL